MHNKAITLLIELWKPLGFDVQQFATSPCGVACQSQHGMGFVLITSYIDPSRPPVLERFMV